MALLMLAGAAVSPLPPEQRTALWVMPIFYALVAAWGIVTGIGILQLRRWAWVSIIVMSGVTSLFGLFGAVVLMFLPSLLKEEPDVPAARVKIVVFVGLVMVLIPIAIAIWWLVLITRAHVRLQFASRGAATIPLAVAGGAAAPDFAPSDAAAPSAPKMPTSVLVIAIVSLVGGGLAVAGLPLTIRMKLPTMIFGILIHGRAVWAYAVLPTVFGLLLVAVILYFLVTRRKAFRAACDARRIAA